MSPDASSTRLLVLRHGRSAWNAQGRWQGHADVALDDMGRSQARAAAEEVPRMGPFAAVWASDLCRARETADIIAAALGDLPVRVDRRLRENHVGPWEGLTAEEVEHGWPGFLAERRRPDGFELYDVAAERMLSCFGDIAAEQQGAAVLVVSHGGIIRATRRRLGGADEHMPNLGGSWFAVAPNGVATAGDVVTLGSVRESASEVL